MITWYPFQGRVEVPAEDMWSFAERVVGLRLWAVSERALFDIGAKLCDYLNIPKENAIIEFSEPYGRRSGLYVIRWR